MRDISFVMLVFRVLEASVSVEIFFGFERGCSVCVWVFVFGFVCVLGCVWFWFGALSMLLLATFYVAKSDCFNVSGWWVGGWACLWLC